jgi:hypothetical protein
MTHYHGPAPAQVWRELGPCCSAALNLAPLPVQVSSVLVCLVNKQQLRPVRRSAHDTMQMHDICATQMSQPVRIYQLQHLGSADIMHLHNIIHRTTH